MSVLELSRMITTNPNQHESVLDMFNLDTYQNIMKALSNFDKVPEALKYEFAEKIKNSCDKLDISLEDENVDKSLYSDFIRHCTFTGNEMYDGNIESEEYKNIIKLAISKINRTTYTKKNVANQLLEYIKNIKSDEQFEIVNSLMESFELNDDIKMAINEVITLKKKIISYGINVCELIPDEISMTPKQIEILLGQDLNAMAPEYKEWLNEYNRMINENDLSSVNIFNRIPLMKDIPLKYFGILI